MMKKYFLSRQWRRFLPAVFWMGVIFYFSSIPDLSSGLPSLYDMILRKGAHSVEYFVLAYLWWFAVKEMTLPVRKKLFFVFVVTFVYSLFDEYHQLFVAGRHGSFVDVVVDNIGALAAVVWLKKTRVTKT